MLAVFHQAFGDLRSQFTDRQAFDVFGGFWGNDERQRAPFPAALENAKTGAQLSAASSQALLRSFMTLCVCRDVLTRGEALIAADDKCRHVVHDDVLIRTPKGATALATRMHKTGKKNRRH